MEKREKALYQELLKNEEEQEKWTKHKSDHEDAIKNLEAFRKKMTVEVMVPIGTKAFMPGNLIHTNEVLVSHFGKMFSKCTSHQAEEICKKRIKIATDYLTKLETERDLFINKLEIPHKLGALPEFQQQEIIEEYDEEKEKLWRANHKKNVRLQKLKERELKTEKELKTHDDIMQKLEELEMMDELETELEEIGIIDDDTLKKMMSGDIKLPECKRISHHEKEQSCQIHEDVPITSNENVQNNDLECIYAKYKTIKISDFERNTDSTNNNNIPNDVDFNNSRNNIDSDELSDDSSDSEIPEEFFEIRKQAEEVPTYHKRINFIRKKIKQIENEIDTLKISNPNELDMKLDKIETRDYLIDYAFTLEDEENTNSKDVASNNIDIEELEIKPKKRISFALKDEIKYIDKNEKVVDMLNDKRNEQIGKDKIVLDPQFQIKNKSNLIKKDFNGNNNKLSIIEKVERNLEYMQEKQSHDDFDLVSKILNFKKANTLQIKFQHSKSIYKHNSNDCNLTGSPVDFYEMFSEIYPQNITTKVFIDANKSEDNEETSKKQIETIDHMKEKIKNINLLTETSVENNGPITEISTILKNKDAVKQEAHFKKYSQTKINKKKDKEIIPRMTLGEVIENSISIKPDDLPNEKFVDAHAPKKRISKFKQSRSLVA